VKITKIETIRIAEHPNLIWVQVHTDDGLIGLGETFFGACAVEAYIHETAAPLLIGKDPLEIDRISKSLVGYLGFGSSGVEMRGNSAIDIALWNLFGKAAN
jgi:galactonate dehydratase